MLGLDRNLVVHDLGIQEDAKPIKKMLQKIHPKIELMVKE